MFYHPRDYTWVFRNCFTYVTLHRMCLARGSLTVGKDSTVESLNDTVDDGCCRIIVDFLLCRIHVKYFIESKFKRLFIFIFFILDGKRLILNYLMAMDSPDSLLLLIKWSKATDYFYISSCLNCGIVFISRHGLRTNLLI